MNVQAINEGLKEATIAKDHIFKAQDAINYEDGLRELEDALQTIREKLEAFDRLCRDKVGH